MRDIGVVFGQRSQLWWDVPVIDSFELLRDIYSITNSTYRNNLEELTVLLDLKEILKTPARQLSLGQRMRCEIAASLLHSPGILFLDEPTIGLDAVSKLAVRDFIKQLNQDHKTTVILTTHDMQDIEALTNRILLIGNGRILMDGSPEELKQDAASMDEAVVKLYRALTRKRGDESNEKVSLFFRMRFLMGLQYRAAAAAGVVTQFTWGFMELLVLEHFIRQMRLPFQ